MTYVVLAFGLTALFIGGDLLVKGATGIAMRLGLSPMVIGLTVVGFGTSAPELLVSLNAALGGQPGIAIGNVIGSNIANSLLILGVAAVLVPVAVPISSIRRDLLWMTGASVALPVLFWSGSVGLIEGLALVAALIVFLVINLKGAGQNAETLPQAVTLPVSIAISLGGLVAVMVGAHYLVESATVIARTFGVSEAMIGLSIVAVGTSLPELATTVMAVIRGQRDIAVGNVIGSNLFNILGILGITALVTPIPLDARFMQIDTPFLILITLLLVGLFWQTGKLGRPIGAVMLAVYVGYLALTAGF